MAQKDLKNVAKAVRRIEQAEAALARACLAAQESGEVVRDIAPYAGVSPAKVHQLIRQAKKAKPG